MEPTEIFRAKRWELEKIDGIGTIRANSIRQFSDFATVESEIRFIEKYGIKPLFISDEDYPKRLLNCYDSPTLLYFRGDANLNASRTVSIIGTRNHTEYGKQLTEKLVTELSGLNVQIISGLAFGIDAMAHKWALKQKLSTIGVLAHGLDQVYPSQHRGLAKDMIKQGGGLLTEFKSGIKPDKHNFPTRNRVVAGMCDATIVIETGVSGGSLITAELANGYNRDVFAFPGRIIDNKSGGCNELIRSNKAILLTDTDQLTQLLGWQAKDHKKPEPQKRMFLQLTENEQMILSLLEEGKSLNIDEINLRSGLSSSAVAAAVLSLEMQNAIKSLPGKMFVSSR
jgi:DNA processing protein